MAMTKKQCIAEYRAKLRKRALDAVDAEINRFEGLDNLPYVIKMQFQEAISKGLNAEEHYYHTCGFIWSIANLNLISSSEAIKLIEKAALALHEHEARLQEEEELEKEFDGKIYNMFGELTFDANDPECLAAFGIE